MAVVLIPLDSSKSSEYCIEYYLKYLHREGNQVHTCYVSDYFGDVGVLEGPTPGRIRELEEEDKRKAAAIEAGVTKIFQSAHIDGNFTRLTAKNPWHKIIEHSKAIHATLIVIGSRGMGKVRRTIMGSVSESVLHHSDIPVLICKHPSEKHH
ncbi:universal stress protein a-like protein [Plakobranchus ocellatus]|uniref:Universal stress protein a-like protein n=1 Tax=Plakobranchus ocellatus TaxID=259542 RepID=A0AAV4DIM8_9GAST|nr:universal stress protein a-like protein [Plakobranchus ocellatus]